MKRRHRVVATVLFTGLAVAYLIWKIDIGKTIDDAVRDRAGLVRARRWRS